MSGVAVAIGAVIGLLLGLLGGGGAIVTVPALVYLLGQDVSSATVTSLAVVGANALLGAAAHHWAGRVRWRTALPFGGLGLLGAVPGAWLNHLLPGQVVLVLFAGVLLLAAALVHRKVAASAPAPGAGSRRWPLAAVAGAAVGFLSGLFGIGGGFLVVPTLAAGLRLPMAAAVGTSLAVIALNSSAGLVAHLVIGRPGLGGAPDATSAALGVPLSPALPLLAGSAVGVLVGSRLAGRLPEPVLRRLFALLLVAIAAALIVPNVGG